MKFVIFGIIVILAGLIGFEIKRKYVEQKDFLEFLISFLNYSHMSISVYKTNIDEIINNYLIQQKNKNAKYTNIFTKCTKNYTINQQKIEKYIYDNELGLRLTAFFEMFGKMNLEEECVNIKSILKIIEVYSKKTTEEIKTKGDLYFKISLIIGVVVVILLW